MEEVDLNAGEITSLSNTFRACYKLRVVRDFDLKNNTSFENAFLGCIALEILHLTNWAKYNIVIQQSSKLSPESIKYIIWHALNGANTLGYKDEGAISRTLTLNETPYGSWETWKLTKPSVEDCEFLGIDETEITKYGELTWEDIALNIKLITIAK